MDKECKGCNTPCTSYMKPVIIYDGREERCPCIECLIKPACTEDCPKMMSFFHMSIGLAVSKMKEGEVLHFKMRRQPLDRN